MTYLTKLNQFIQKVSLFFFPSLQFSYRVTPLEKCYEYIYQFILLITLSISFCIGQRIFYGHIVLFESLPLLTILISLSFLVPKLTTYFYIGYALSSPIYVARNLIEQNENSVFFDTFKVIGSQFIYLTLIYILLIHVPRLIYLIKISVKKQYDTAISISSALLIPFLWSQAVPILIRPVWIWFDTQPEISGIEPVQQRFWVLCISTLISLYLVDMIDKKILQLFNIQAAPFQEQENSKFTNVHVSLKRISYSMIITLLLSGLYTNWLEPILTFVIILSSFLLRQSISKLIPNSYHYLIDQIPFAYRYYLAVFMTIFLGWICITINDGFDQSFLPILIAVFLGQIIYSFFLDRKQPL